jgi:DNA-binding NtrC family response regulator
MTLSAASMAALSHYPWPGNIRELDNVLARAVILSPTESIEPEVLGLDVEDPHRQSEFAGTFPYLNLPYHDSIREHSRALLLNALRLDGWNQTKAAERLGLQRTYLARLIKQYNVREDADGAEVMGSTVRTEQPRSG